MSTNVVFGAEQTDVIGTITSGQRASGARIQVDAIPGNKADVVFDVRYTQASSTVDEQINVYIQTEVAAADGSKQFDDWKQVDAAAGGTGTGTFATNSYSVAATTGGILPFKFRVRVGNATSISLTAVTVHYRSVAFADV